jgi:DNA mismatch endonuclease (patch repair protein)
VVKDFAGFQLVNVTRSGERPPSSVPLNRAPRIRINFDAQSRPETCFFKPNVETASAREERQHRVGFGGSSSCCLGRLHDENVLPGLMKKRQKELPSPRFTGRPASDAASRAKRRTPRVNTAPELVLRRALWAVGLRYRKNVRALTGTPDIVFHRSRVAVFCDGDFWHGKDWLVRRRKLAHGANSAYWTEKIASNMRRDLHVNESLRADGWNVLRFWESDLTSRLPEVVAEIMHALEKRRA